MLAKTAERSAVNAWPSLARPIEISSHRLHDLRKEDESREAGLEARLRRRVLKLASFQRLAGEPFVERRDFAGIRGTEKHLREQLIRIEGDGREQAVERVWRRGLFGRGRGLFGHGRGLLLRWQWFDSNRSWRRCEAEPGEHEQGLRADHECLHAGKAPNQVRSNPQYRSRTNRRRAIDLASSYAPFDDRFGRLTFFCRSFL